MVYEPSQRPFIVRIRCPQGLLRIPVTGKERWNTIVRNLPASHLPPNTTCTLIKSTDTGKTDLLSSYINGQTLDDQGVQHGDMFYLQPESAPRQDQVAIESKSSSHTSQPVDISRSTLTSPQPSSTKQEQVESVTSNWSHVAIFARIRGNFCPGSGVPTKTAT